MGMLARAAEEGNADGNGSSEPSVVEFSGDVEGERRILSLKEKECMTIPMQFGVIENREGPEDSRMWEGSKNHTLEHRYDPRDLVQVVVSLRDDN